MKENRTEYKMSYFVLHGEVQEAPLITNLMLITDLHLVYD